MLRGWLFVALVRLVGWEVLGRKVVPNIPLTVDVAGAGKLSRLFFRPFAFFSAFARLAFAMRFEAELFEVAPLLSFASRANVLVAATKIIAECSRAESYGDNRSITQS